LAVSKPSGLLTHPGADARRPDLMTLLRRYYELPDLVLQHRLDRETSGLILLTLHAAACGAVYRSFEQRKVVKTYQVWVQDPGQKLDHQFACELGILERKGRVSAHPGGLVARTEFQLMRRKGPYALLSAHPVTGRKHQIRVHLQALGWPVVGDSLYGGAAAAPRLMLHAWKLALEHPSSHDPILLQAEPGRDFTEFATPGTARDLHRRSVSAPRSR
jgi:23S rRNA-/tRNA-specific pseudouridylate synthase